MAPQPMGILNAVGLHYRPSGDVMNAVDGNGEEEKKNTLEALTDEDFIHDIPSQFGSPSSDRNVSQLLHCGLSLSLRVLAVRVYYFLNSGSVFRAILFGSAYVSVAHLTQVE